MINLDACLDALDLITKLLHVDPKTRMTVAEAVNHWWMKLDSVHPKSPLKKSSLDANGNIVGDDISSLYADATWSYGGDCSNNISSLPTPIMKSILKRKDSSSSDVLSPMFPSNSDQPHVLEKFTEDVFNCGLQAKDSLKLKSKPQGSSHKRRIMRPKRDRESGYYSSPERNHEPAAPSPGQVPAIKPVLTSHNPVRKPSLKAKKSKSTAHNSSQFDEMLGNFTASMEQSYKQSSLSQQTNTDCNRNNDNSSVTNTSLSTCTNAQRRPYSTPISVPLSSIKRSRGSETPEALTPTSAHLAAELQRILPPREGSKRGLDTTVFNNSYEYLAKSTSNDDFSNELEMMMKQLNLELEQAYENAIRQKSTYSVN